MHLWHDLKPMKTPLNSFLAEKLRVLIAGIDVSVADISHHSPPSYIVCGKDDSRTLIIDLIY